jgi:hypothetical protein
MRTHEEGANDLLLDNFQRQRQTLLNAVYSMRDRERAEVIAATLITAEDEFARIVPTLNHNDFNSVTGRHFVDIQNVIDREARNESDEKKRELVAAFLNYRNSARNYAGHFGSSANTAPAAAQRVEVVADDYQDADHDFNAAPASHDNNNNAPPAAGIDNNNNAPPAPAPGNNNNAPPAPAPGNNNNAPPAAAPGNNNNVPAAAPLGGNAAGAAAAPVDVTSAKAQLATADSQLSAAIANLKLATTQQAIDAKLKEAKDALHTFSHHSLTQQMEEQHKQLQASIMALATGHQDDLKAALNVALQNYHTKLIQLANAKLKEINLVDQQINDSYDYVRKSGFSDPSGANDGANINSGASHLVGNLGIAHSHIKRIDTKTGKKIIVHLENGVMSSTSPEDLAHVAKSKGNTSFEFTDADTTKWNNGKDLKNAMKAMIRVGVPKISVNENLQAELADKLGPASRSEFDRLLRICAASKAMADTLPGNHVFDDKGNLWNGLNPNLKKHEVLTFMHLTNAKDRLAYVSILYPNDSGKHYSLFTDELAKAGVNTITTNHAATGPNGEPLVDANNNSVPMQLSPQEYFEQELLPREPSKPGNRRREKVTEQYAQWRGVPAEFEAASNTAAQREAIYSNGTPEHPVLDPAVQTRLAESAALNDDERKTLLRKVFSDAQENGTHAIALNRHPLSKVRDIKEADLKAFLDKAAPLMAKLTTAPQDKEAMITELRNITLNSYNAARLNNASKAFENFYKNKLLIDALEAKTFTETELLAQHAPQHRNPGEEAARAQHFIYRLSPAMQLALLLQNPQNADGTANPNALDINVRAEIIKGYIERYAQVGTADALYFLKTSITPVLEQVDKTNDDILLLADEIESICSGCDAKENQALVTVRELIIKNRPAAEPAATNFVNAAKSLEPAKLFEFYYSQANNTATQANCLLERINCYAQEMASSINPLRYKEFVGEMRGLGVDSHNDLANLVAILQQADADLTIQGASNSTRTRLIERINQLRPEMQAKGGFGRLFAGNVQAPAHEDADDIELLDNDWANADIRA